MNINFKNENTINLEDITDLHTVVAIHESGEGMLLSREYHEDGSYIFLATSLGSITRKNHWNYGKHESIQSILSFANSKGYFKEIAVFKYPKDAFQWLADRL